MIPSPLYKDPIYNGAADPMIIKKESDGLFYMFYTQRRANQQVEGVSFAYGTAIGVAESEDGADWHYRGALELNFDFGGKYWLISDVWQGLAVYFSEDGENFVRQAENILIQPGTQNDDNAKGAHADIFVVKDRAFIIYFTHPDTSFPEKSAVQMAELKIENGKLVCDRNAEFDVCWK